MDKVKQVLASTQLYPAMKSADQKEKANLQVPLSEMLKEFKNQGVSKVKNTFDFLYAQQSLDLKSKVVNKQGEKFISLQWLETKSQQASGSGFIGGCTPTAKPSILDYAQILTALLNAGAQPVGSAIGYTLKLPSGTELKTGDSFPPQSETKLTHTVASPNASRDITQINFGEYEYGTNTRKGGFGDLPLPAIKTPETKLESALTSAGQDTSSATKITASKIKLQAVDLNSNGVKIKGSDSNVIELNMPIPIKGRVVGSCSSGNYMATPGTSGSGNTTFVSTTSGMDFQWTASSGLCMYNYTETSSTFGDFNVVISSGTVSLNASHAEVKFSSVIRNDGCGACIESSNTDTATLNSISGLKVDDVILVRGKYPAVSIPGTNHYFWLRIVGINTTTNKVSFEGFLSQTAYAPGSNTILWNPWTTVYK